MVIKVCVIGAGPSGMSCLAQFQNLSGKGEEVEVTCYEKQEQPGGLWNLTWRTGLDEHGESVHCSQYRDLFSNGPKECLEFPEYSFKDHFDKNIPSFPPREVLIDYLRGYWRFCGVNSVRDVKVSHAVKSVTWNEPSETFTVRVKDLTSKKTMENVFDRVIIATGHFSVPHVPSFKGINQFEGRVLHAHDFRNAREFAGQRVLLIGSSYSAEDIGLQLYKFGAKSITISYRTNKMGFTWPKTMKEVPLLKEINGKTCHFIDATYEDFDAMILCTGYQHSFPFMPGELTLECPNIMNIPNCYRNLQWYGVEQDKNDCGGKLFYVAMQDQYYTFTMFDMQARWVASVIKGIIQVPDRETCVAAIAAQLEENAVYKGCEDQIHGQTKYVKTLADDLGYTENIDVTELFLAWEHHKDENILTYRDRSHQSIVTNDVSPVHPLPWVKCMQDSLDAYINAI